MRHCRGSLISGVERFFNFADFRTLQMADFGSELLKRSPDSGNDREHECVPIPLDDLRRRWRNFETKCVTDLFLQVRRNMGVRSNGAGDLSHCNVFAR